ncbi:hypothetical protein FB45DRAFT_6550 [Roridomyces roridus]|uniref:Uncharacterized protein n=1 Tax=Roridomyces roridus TaxID=1738132 RepID=A0AAD7CIH8_9AGAR|nr:hypothetical protein FB45DRAFT_6550 [Roridomyces roridus]
MSQDVPDSRCDDPSAKLLKDYEESIDHPRFTSTLYLGLANIALHIGLVLVHIGLLIVGLKRLEHAAIFPTQSQKTVSFWVTAATTGLGTVYCSGLIFLSQKLVLQHMSRPSQTPTAMHDTLSSWNGIGSAISTLRNQLRVPSSVMGSISILAYLGCIAILHISIPTSLSVETFNSTTTVNVPTLGRLEFNSTDPVSSYHFLVHFALGLMPWMSNMPTLGLSNGTLFDVLQNTTLGAGEAMVPASGFNVTCGYLPASFLSSTPEAPGFPSQMQVSLDQLGIVTLQVPYQNTITVMLNQTLFVNNSLILSTPCNVIDSLGKTGNPVVLNQTLQNNTISSIQFLQCSKSVVEQSGIVDTQSRALKESTLFPSIHKMNSQWQPATSMDFESQNFTALGGDVWSQIISAEMSITNYFFDSSVEGCRIVEAVNTRGSARQNQEKPKNDRTIVWSFKRSHYGSTWWSRPRREDIYQ